MSARVKNFGADGQAPTSVRGQICVERLVQRGHPCWSFRKRQVGSKAARPKPR